MALSNFAQNPTGLGGTITVYLNGQSIATWNATDDKGNLVPNSFYHFVLEEHPTNGNPVLLERDSFITPYHGDSVAFVAMPNVGYSGDVIHFSASFSGTQADGQSKIKIYATSGELVKTLDISNGAALWSLDNLNGQVVSSGVYLAVLEGIDPTTGQKARKISKVLVSH